MAAVTTEAALRIASLLGLGVTRARIQSDYPEPPLDSEGAMLWLEQLLGGENCRVVEVASIDVATRKTNTGVILAALSGGQYAVIRRNDSGKGWVADCLSEAGVETVALEMLMAEKGGELGRNRVLNISKAIFDERSQFSEYEQHWFFSAIVRNRGFLVQAGVASLVTNVFALGVSLFSLIVYNKIIPAQAMSSLTVLVIGMVIVLLMDYLIKVSRSKLLGVTGVEADLTIADRLFSKIVETKFDGPRGSVGALANTLKEYEQVREFLTSASIVAFFDLPFAGIFLLIIWLIGGWMAVPVMVGILLIVGVAVVVQPKLRRLAETSFEDGQSKHSVLVETLSGLETIKLLGAGGIMRERFRKVLGRQVDLGEETKSHTHLAQNFGQEVQQLVQISVVTIGAITVSNAQTAFGAIIACTILSGKAIVPFMQLTQMLLRLNQVRAGYNALDNFMKQPSEREVSVGYIERGRLDGDIRFENVQFTYPGQESRALSDINLEISVGEKVAIVGRVGSGKSTLGKLIARLYEASEGKISVGGVDIRQIDPTELRQNIGYVSQDPWLLAGTIEENITLGASNISHSDLLWAAKVSGVSSFVDRHPQGYKLAVRERGEGLSGGQKQCIAVARAIIRRPPILVLDEPTSSMDARTERSFIESFGSHQIDSTLVIITHRTSLLSMVDRVVVMDDSKIVGSGPPDSFMGKRASAVAAESVGTG